MNRACEEIIGHRMPSTGFRSRAGPTGASCTTRSAASARSSTMRCSPSCGTVCRHLTEEIGRPGEGVKAVMPGIRPCSIRSRRAPTSSSGCSPATSSRARASSSNTSISGATSAAARSATMRRIATRWCRSPSSRAQACGLGRLLRRRSSWSATRRTTSPAPAPSAPSRSPSPPDVQRRSAARQRGGDCVQRPQRHGGVMDALSLNSAGS